MAAIYGSSLYIWNITIYEESLKLHELLKGHFSNITLITGIALVVLGPFIMFANGIVIAAIWKDPYKQLRSAPSNIIITSMAVCDFLVGICCVFIQASWLFSMSLKSRTSEYFSPIAYSSGALLIGISITHVLALTIDRVIAVASPLLYKSRVTRKRVLVSVFLIWVTWLFVEILQIPLYKHYYINSVISMSSFNIIGLPVPFLSLFIIHCVKKHSNERKNSKTRLSTDSRIFNERDRKTTKSVLIILAFLPICFTPFFVTWVVLLGCSRCHHVLDAIVTSYFLSFILTHVNSGINPILYAFRLPKFRKPVWAVVKDLFFCCKTTRIEGVIALNATNKTPQTFRTELYKFEISDKKLQSMSTILQQEEKGNKSNNEKTTKQNKTTTTQTKTINNKKQRNSIQVKRFP